MSRFDSEDDLYKDVHYTFNKPLSKISVKEDSVKCDMNNIDYNNKNKGNVLYNKNITAVMKRNRELKSENDKLHKDLDQAVNDNLSLKEYIQKLELSIKKIKKN